MRHFLNARGVLVLFLFLASRLAFAAPIRTLMPAQHVKVSVARQAGDAVLLPHGLKARVLFNTLAWKYIPNTRLSVPYFKVKFSGIPVPNDFSLVFEREAKVSLNSKGDFTLELPFLKRENTWSVTVIDPKGHFEVWGINVHVSLAETSIFVDESCEDYHFKIREVKRAITPNLIFIGCRAGSGPKELSLDILWDGLDRIEYRGQTVQAQDAVLVLPLEPRRTTVSDLVGISKGGERNLYEVEYQPYVPPPYEIWVGLAFYESAFQQSNFGAKFNQISSAFLGQFWLRPEDINLSIMIRGFGTINSFSQTLTPNMGYQEGVSTWFLDGEIRYQIFHDWGFRLDPFFGGWVFFMNVKSHNFGLQRVIDPILGFVLQKSIGRRDSLGFTLRFVPFQPYFNPLQFSLAQAYTEIELTYAHPLRKRNRIFATLYSGTLNYNPPQDASTAGSYFVLGGGYGW